MCLLLYFLLYHWILILLLPSIFLFVILVLIRWPMLLVLNYRYPNMIEPLHLFHLVNDNNTFVTHNQNVVNLFELFLNLVLMSYILDLENNFYINLYYIILIFNA